MFLSIEIICSNPYLLAFSLSKTTFWQQTKLSALPLAAHKVRKPVISTSRSIRNLAAPYITFHNNKNLFRPLAFPAQFLEGSWGAEMGFFPSLADVDSLFGAIEYSLDTRHSVSFCDSLYSNQELCLRISEILGWWHP